MRPLLIGEDFSPWTEKARWALAHHGLDHDFHQYQPLIEEPWLRFKTRNVARKATVPVLIDGSAIVPESLSIARYADRLGRGATLFPAGDDSAIETWNETSDRALRAGRALFFARLLNDHAAQIDNLPPFVPARLRALLRPVVHGGVLYLRFKHGAGDAFARRAREELGDSLSKLRAALAGRAHLLGQLSYADIAMAVVLQFIQPVDDRYIRLSSANRACWTEPALAREHADLIAWRDELYARARS